MTLHVLLFHIILLSSLKNALGTLIHTAVDPSALTNNNDLSTSDENPSAALSSSISQSDFHQQHDEGSPSSVRWNADYIWSPQFDADEFEDEVPIKRIGQSFIRLGRSRSNAFMRLGRGGDKGFIRFGRSGGTSPNGNLGRRDNSFLRFGRANGENYISASGTGSSNDDGMRFGRRGDKFIRFGRSPQKFDTGSNSVSSGNFRNSIERDNIKRYEDGGGKASRMQSFIRLGRSRSDSNFIRLGKKSNDDSVKMSRWQALPLTIPEYLKSTNGIRQRNDELTSNLIDLDPNDSFIQKPTEVQRSFENDSADEK